MRRVGGSRGGRGRVWVLLKVEVVLEAGLKWEGDGWGVMKAVGLWGGLGVTLPLPLPTLPLTGAGGVLGGEGGWEAAVKPQAEYLEIIRQGG